MQNALNERYCVLKGDGCLLGWLGFGKVLLVQLVILGSEQGLQWRLEVFKTRFKGWGVRSWDTIPVGSYVATFFGRVYRIEDTNPTQDDTFYFDLGKRIDYSWDNQRIEHGFDT